MSNKTAAARKNGAFGFKALIKYNDGRTHIPVSKNFKTRGEAIAYAEKWIYFNDNRVVFVRSEKVLICG